jgi:cephalosporin-C deacetylase
MPAPGIYHATITVNDDLARGFFFAVKPEQIVSAADKQSDFDSYWAAAKQQLAQVPINATLTEIPSKSGAKRKVYLVEMQSIADGLSGNPVTIRGYYAEPQDGKKHPVLIHYQGYDSEYRPGGDSATPWCINAKYDTDESANYAEFVLSNRGQSVNNRPASGRDDGINRDFENIYGDWFAYQFGNKDSYYYRGAYMDCLRAIDFMASRETSDMQNLFAEGQSQGGAFTVAAAALSDRPFNAIAPAITFMGDFPDYFEIVSWPGYVAFNNKGSMTDAEMYAFMSYYDTKNLATSITSPYITSIGLQDNVCPPHTNIAPYNNVQTPASDKQIVYNPELQHATNSKWNDTYMTFFKKYMKDTTGIRSVGSNSLVTDNCYYDLYGRKVVNPQRGIYLVNGRKNIIR